jgi:hypothetical protein
MIFNQFVLNCFGKNRKHHVIFLILCCHRVSFKGISWPRWWPQISFHLIYNKTILHSLVKFYSAIIILQLHCQWVPIFKMKNLHHSTTLLLYICLFLPSCNSKCQLSSESVLFITINIPFQNLSRIQNIRLIIQWAVNDII